MSREDVEKLLGGYATGTLTPEEQQALFEAALDDQELFDALAREQSLRDLLRDPAARAHLLAALDDAPPRRWSVLWARLRRPVAVAVAMAGVGGIGVFLARRNVQAPQVVTVAQMRPPAPMPGTAAQAEEQTGPAPVRERRVAKKTERPEPAAEAPAGFQAVPAPLREAPPIKAKELKAEPPAPTGEALADSQTVRTPVLEARAARANQVKAEGPAPVAGAPAESQTAPARVQEAQSVKAKAVKAEQSGSAGGLAAGAIAGLRTPVARPPAPPDAPAGGAGGASSQNARAQFEAALDRAAPPPASNQPTPVKKQGAQAARAGLVRPATPVSAASVVEVGVPYSVLRKLPGGEFVEADPNQELAAGETIKLRFVPNDDGYLYVLESGPDGSRQTIATGHVERLKPFETPELKPGAPGEKEYYVLFTRRPQPAAGLGGAGFTIKLKYR